MNEVFVCKQEDDFVFEQPHWIAHLSNGEKIIQDDGRPDVVPASAWLRLAKYCRQHSLNVVDLTLQFRSHHEAPLPKYMPGYYFVNKCVKPFQGGPTLSFLLIGYIDEDKIRVQHWKIPELMLFGEEDRPIESAGESLIRNNYD